jgi:hypothetical protein
MYSLLFYILYECLSTIFADKTSATIKIHNTISSFCDKCRKSKPIATHHCSKCNQCIAEFDHFCWYLNVCIGGHNYNSFVRFMIAISVAMLILLYLHASIGLDSIRLQPNGLAIVLGMLNVIILIPLTTIMVMLNYNIWDVMGRGITVIQNLSYDEDDVRPRWSAANCRQRLGGR